MLALYLKPVLPGLAAQVEQFLQIPPLRWSDVDHPLLGHAIAEFKPLMQRVEMAQIAAIIEESKEGAPSGEETPAPSGPLIDDPIGPVITIEDFAKVDLRVARIVKAEAVAGPTSCCGWNWTSAAKPARSSPASNPPTRRKRCKIG